MRKNGSRLISLKQYRFTDMFLFAAILAGFEVIVYVLAKNLLVNFAYSALVPIVLLVMMRWGWPSVFYALLDGVFFCALNRLGWQCYLIYGIGNCAIMLLLLMTRFMGKQKIAGKWYFSLLFVILGWVAVMVGRIAFALPFGYNFFTVINLYELVSLAVAILIILVMRRLDGMFEDQKHYLLRLDKERKEKMKRDEFGDEPVDIDEDTISILRKRDDDLY